MLSLVSKLRHAATTCCNQLQAVAEKIYNMLQNSVSSESGVEEAADFAPQLQGYLDGHAVGRHPADHGLIITYAHPDAPLMHYCAASAAAQGQKARRRAGVRLAAFHGHFTGLSLGNSTTSRCVRGPAHAVFSNDRRLGEHSTVLGSA